VTSLRDQFSESADLGDVIAVSAGQGGTERCSGGVGDQVVLGTGLSAVDRAGPDMVPL
jgi:hypothetical protein